MVTTTPVLQGKAVEVVQLGRSALLVALSQSMRQWIVEMQVVEVQVVGLELELEPGLGLGLGLVLVQVQEQGQKLKLELETLQARLTCTHLRQMQPPLRTWRAFHT